MSTTIESEVIKELRKSDQEFIRVLEDLIWILIEDGTVSLDRFPVEARKKLTERGVLRKKVNGGD